MTQTMSQTTLQSASQTTGAYKPQVRRDYGAADVERLSGSVRIEHTLAKLGAARLRELLARRPFVRTLGQAQRVTELLAAQGLKRGENELKVIMMCEIPSNAVLAHEFLKFFDGFSIGSNDLTQLTLGLDRDSGLELLAHDFDERDPAVKALLKLAIGACKAEGKYVGICGQGPSDHPDFAQWLRDEGISSISLNPDTVVDTWQLLAGTKG